MTIKIAVLKTQQQVIADFKEIMSGEEPVAYLFKDPHVVDFNQFSYSKEENNQSSINSNEEQIYAQWGMLDHTDFLSDLQILIERLASESLEK